MANLVVDIGNSRTKIAVFNERKLVHSEAFSDLSIGVVEKLLEKFRISSSILSTVTSFDEKLEFLLKDRSAYRRFSYLLPAGIQLNYHTPETLGLDRLAGVIGAHALFPGRNCLVIDAGTCITYDLVDEQGNYYGGSISPGMEMRLKAMHTFTGKLPLVEKGRQLPEPIGRDTRTSMLSGVLQGTVHEVHGFIGQYNTKYPAVQVVLCGGDAEFFDTELKNSIFAHSVKTEAHLVLIGLNEVIHHYND